MQKRERSDSRLIYIRSNPISFKVFVWLVPVLAFIMIGLVTLYGRNYRKSTGSMDAPMRIATREMGMLINPLKLTALHFETLSPGFVIPQETLARHLRLLQKIGPYRTLAIVNLKQGEIAAAGEKKDRDRFTVQIDKLPNRTHVSPITSHTTLAALQIAIPMNPTTGETHWLIATVPADTLLHSLPSGVSIVIKKKKAKVPLHPAAPRLTLEVDPIAKPIWPLLLGELMLALGIVFLLVGAKSKT